MKRCPENVAVLLSVKLGGYKSILELQKIYSAKGFWFDAY
jgi:hypothetical protein